MRIGVPAVLLISLVLTWADFRHRTLFQHCGTTDHSLTRIDSTCVGVSDGRHDLFDPSDPGIRTVESAIRHQNGQAARLHAKFPRRPYITVVGLFALTSTTGTADSLTSERESLEGLAVAQRIQEIRSSSSDPIMRVLIANAGPNMKQGPLIARRIGTMAKNDPSIVGVVGLDMSSTSTELTIKALSDAGIPTIASTLSADDLARLSPLYYQISPQNRREAAVTAAFAAHLRTQDSGISRQVRIYSSDDPADTYSSNLAKDAAAQFAARGFTVHTSTFRAGTFRGQDGDAGAAGSSTCGGYKGFAFFAGRGEPDFGDFLAGAQQCQSQATVIGGDDVTRFVADESERTLNTMSYYYLSFASVPNAPDPSTAASAFYGHLSNWFPFEKTQATAHSADGHAALAYDAANVLLTATQYLRRSAPIPVSTGAIWHEIATIQGAGNGTSGGSINEASGVIDYSGRTSQYPDDKRVELMRVRDGKVTRTPKAMCGLPLKTQDPWCPDTN